MAGNPRVLELLEEMLDSAKTPEEVCCDCPELLPEVRRRWQEFCRIDARVAELLPGSPPPQDYAVPPVPPTAGLPQVPGYQVEAELGRGGMGVVYRARHLALRRTVALKMLAAGHSHPDERARFQAEAEAVARLQHPNVVQIHEIGEAAGLPFLALELVEGGSLSRRLAGRPLMPRDAGRLVAALAEAMHLAHSRNLIHRDLKPANVLLAGEADTPVGQCQPKVSDFGLARQLDADSGRTQIGVVLGTPSYMAPEQAEGQGHAAGPAADIWALGAILYECLTGRPPFRGATPLETLEQVRTREPAAPSTLNRQVPRDLETICLKCLRKPPEQRYASARELADDLGRFGRGEPVAARPINVAERLRKWVRRRPAAAGLLAAMVLLAAAGAVGAWLLYRQGVRQAGTDQEVRGIVDRAHGLLEGGWQAHDLAKLDEAAAEGNRAADIARSGGASAAVRQEVEAFREDASARLERARKTRGLLEAVLDIAASQQESRGYTDDGRGGLMVTEPLTADEQYAAAFRRWGLDVDGMEEAEVVARLGDQPAAVVQELVGALDSWMLERRQRKRPEADWQRLGRIAEQLDGSERRRRLRALLVDRSLPRAEGVAAQAALAAAGPSWPAVWELARGDVRLQLLAVRREVNPHAEAALTVLLLANALGAAGDVTGSERLLTESLTARPDEVVLLMALGRVLERQGPSRLGEAIGHYRAARFRRPHLGIALGKAMVDAGRAGQAAEILRDAIGRQPPNAELYSNLGTALAAQRKHAEAAAAFRSGIELKPDFVAVYYNQLGNAQFALRQYAAAEASYRRAIDLQPDLVSAHSNLSNALRDQGQPKAAEQAARKALELQPDFPHAHLTLGQALRTQRQPRAAEAALRKAIVLRPDFPGAYANLSAALLDQGRLREAEAASRKAIELRPGFAAAHVILGSDLNRQGRNRAAEVACREAIELEPDFHAAYRVLATVLNDQRRCGEAAAACRRAIELRPDDGEAYGVLAVAHWGQGQFDAAEAAFRKAIELQPDLGADIYIHSGNTFDGWEEHAAAEGAYRRAVQLRPGYAFAHYALGGFLDYRGRHAEAEAACRKAIELQHDIAEAHSALAGALIAQGRHAEAVAACRTAIELRPDFAHAHYNLAIAFNGQRLYSAAEVACRRTIEFEPDSRGAYENLGIALRGQGRHGAAEAAYRKLIELDPESALAYGNLGLALQAQGQNREAEAAYRKAIELDFGRPALLHYNLGVALEAQGQLAAAEGAYRTALDLEPDLFSAQNNLGWALARQGKDVAAVEQYRRALLLNPKHTLTATGLRAALTRLGRLEEARSVWRHALGGNPPDHPAWYGYAELALFLGQQDEYRRARRALLDRFGPATDPYVAERTGRACLLLPVSGDDLRRAVALAERAAAVDRSKYQSVYPHFQFCWGLAEYRQGRYDRAITVMRGAASGVLEPAPRLVLAMALHRTGRPAEARRTLAAAVLAHDWRASRVRDQDDWIRHVLRREAEELIIPNLAALLDGKVQPRHNDERLALLGVCQFTDRTLASARLYAEAFDADPRLAADLGAGHRYTAAYAAALAGCGRGADALALGEAGAKRWRDQARQWLRADLAEWNKMLDSNLAEVRGRARTVLTHWRSDSDLAGLREPAEVEKLPAEERAECLALWNEVGVALKRTGEVK